MMGGRCALGGSGSAVCQFNEAEGDVKAIAPCAANVEYQVGRRDTLNLDSPAKLGMHVIQMKDAEQLRRELQTLGVVGSNCQSATFCWNLPGWGSRTTALP
jgi:hypothetical protein